MAAITQQKIFEIRGQKVMLDFDLAALYEVETKVFNQAIKRNIESFPDDFMFQLTKVEWQNMMSQNVTSYLQTINNEPLNRSQIVTSSQKHRSKTFLPFAFTEHGVTMLASVLKSSKARQMNIAIVRAFIALRKFSLQHSKVVSQLNELENRVGNHDKELNKIYEAIEGLLLQKEKKKIGKVAIE